MNYDKSMLNNIYVSGLLHDTGKYLQKCGNAKVKHNILSQLFILSNPNICVGADVSTVANLVAHHHNDVSALNSEVMFGPGEAAGIPVIKAASDNYAISENKDYINMLCKADSLAASSDRASEIESGKKGGRAPYAPLISVVGKVFDARVAIRHEVDYKTYLYDGNDETEATINRNDPDFKAHISNSFKAFMKDISSVKHIGDLNYVLEKHWSTVNANTWKPEGESLGNTTTSLYDHSKMTAAIAACLYINSCHDTEGIDIWHVIYNGSSDELFYLVSPEFRKLGLQAPNIIYCTDSDGFFMVPAAFRNEFKSFLKALNKEQYVAFGETIDYNLAPNWTFTGCRNDISARFSEHHQGILDVFNEVIEDTGDEEYTHKHFKDKVIVGVLINNFDRISTKVLTENDSISKLSTLFRVFVNFSDDVKAYLESDGCEVISRSISEIIYACNSDDLYKTQKNIATLYDKYVGGTTGLSFINRLYNRYEDTITNVKNAMQVRADSFGSLGDGISTTIMIRKTRVKISALNVYDKVYKEALSCKNATLYKILKLYDEGFLYRKDKDPNHLVVLSRFAYLISNTKDEADKALLEKCKNVLYDSEKDIIKTLADIYYEAVYDAARNKEEQN